VVKDEATHNAWVRPTHTHAQIHIYRHIHTHAQTQTQTQTFLLSGSRMRPRVMTEDQLSAKYWQRFNQSRHTWNESWHTNAVSHGTRMTWAHTRNDRSPTIYKLLRAFQSVTSHMEWVMPHGWNASRHTNDMGTRVMTAHQLSASHWDRINQSRHLWHESWHAYKLSTRAMNHDHLQPIADRVAQNLEIISQTFSTKQNFAHGIYD